MGWNKIRKKPKIRKLSKPVKDNALKFANEWKHIASEDSHKTPPKKGENTHIKKKSRIESILEGKIQHDPDGLIEDIKKERAFGKVWSQRFDKVQKEYEGKKWKERK